jgi:hypothetical protein
VLLLVFTVLAFSFSGFLPFTSCGGGGGSSAGKESSEASAGTTSGGSLASQESSTGASSAGGAQSGSSSKATPWGAMYVPPSEFGSHGMTGAVVYLRNFNQATVRNILEEAERNNVKLILTFAPTNPCNYISTTAGLDTGDMCGFSRPHQLGVLDVNQVKADLQTFVQNSNLFVEYINKGVIVGIRIFDEPHDRRCSGTTITVRPQDMSEIYNYIKQNFGSNVKVGSTSPPCYIKRTTGDLAFAQYRWPNTQTVQEFFTNHINQAKANGISLVVSLNSNNSNVSNTTFFSAYKTLCEMKPFFITSWQWPTSSKYPYPGVEDRIEDPAVQSILNQIKQACSN